jgi:fumarate reductase subunit D
MEIYVDNEAKFSLHGLLQVAKILVLSCSFIPSVFLLLLVLILLFSVLNKIDPGIEEL